MEKCQLLIFVCYFCFIFSIVLSGELIFDYKPTWESLDQRPLPLWYDKAKFGIFVHWGVYSVPSYKSEWFWWYWKGQGAHADVENFMTRNFKPNFSYADFGPMFTAEFFDADQWADIFQKSGAKYVVLTSKHHEGFTMWPSNYSWNWNSVDTGPHRNIVDELAKAVRRKKITFGLYYSLFEWFHPLWNKDAANNYTTDFYPSTVSLPQLYELVETYQPDVVWSDGDSGPDYYWKSREFLAWLYNSSPVKDSVVVNDRWGFGVPCKHGGYFTCDDRYNPGKLQPRKWENCMTIQRNSWGFDRTARIEEYLSEKELIQSLVETVSYGGNLLLNVGPTHDGRIVPIFEERLNQIGAWLKINGESIYGSEPWPVCQNDTVTPEVWYTLVQNETITTTVDNNAIVAIDRIVYATFFQWPKDGYLPLGCVKAKAKTTEISLLGVPDVKLHWKNHVHIPYGIVVDLLPITFERLPSYTAWTLKMINLANAEA